MKNLNFFLVIFLFFTAMLGLNSCTEEGCVNCLDCPVVIDISANGKYCEEDWSDPVDYEEYIEGLEETGCNCE